MINKQGRESVSRVSGIAKLWSAMMMRFRSVFGDRTRPDARPDATGRDPRAIYLAAEAARSRARRAAKKEIKTMDGSAEPSDRTRPDARPDSDRTRPDATAYIESKIQNIKRAPIPENFWPDEEGYRLGIQAFGADGVDGAIRTHRDTWLGRPEKRTPEEWQAIWRAWCRRNLQPELRLGGPQGVIAARERGKRNGQQSDRRTDWQRRRDDARAALRELGDELASRRGGDSSA